MRLMKTMRESIIENRFEEFVQKFMLNIYPHKDYPMWCTEALNAVNIKLIT